MSFYRSDSINYYKLILPRQSAWEIMNKLGQQKIVHVVPNNQPILTRPFIGQVRRCQESLHKIRNLEKLLEELNIYQSKSQFSVQAYTEIYELWKILYEKSGAHPANAINDILLEIDNAWAYYQDLTKRQEILSTKQKQFRNNLAIIHAGQMKFGRSFFTHRQQRSEQLGRGILNGARMHFKCGIINRADEIRFKRTIFRITKGNSLVQCMAFPQIFPNTLKEQQNRLAFFILFPGRQDSFLDKKLKRLLEAYGQSNYTLPNNEGQFQSIIKELQISYNETENLNSLTQIQINSFLSKLTQIMPESGYFKRHEYLKLYLLKQKELYNGLNEMTIFNNFLQGRIYVRYEDIAKLQNILTLIQRQSNLPAGQLVYSSTSKYPTYYSINDFTRSSQQIIQTYGIARYQEANPSFFTVITFPFLFGVMFGDIAHGSIFLAFGIYLIFWKQKISNPILKMLLPHRYIIALMGFFATYCGFIYNDYLSVSLDIFGSCYPVQGIQAKSPIPRLENCIYPIGLDPVWSVSDNYLNYINSLKMKIAVIIGVTHMTLGVFVKASNALYFKKYMDFFFQFIPQLLFMILLFGYMDFLIIYKWLQDWGYYSAVAPSIITTMINLPLKLGKTDDCCGGMPMWGQYGSTSQDTIQKWFLVISLISIPIMLLPKPLYQMYCSNSRHKESEQPAEGHRLLNNSNDSLQLNERSKTDLIKVNSEIKQKQEAHGNDQIFVHQLIETIQYVLGCISNTASYLRLWALSLAHSQLSEVFFQYLVEGGIVSGLAGIPLQIIGFMFLSGITFGVLLCMDSLQCFLHTLRLHWVQFNNKFYKGDGFSFIFYSFSDRISQQIIASTI